MAGIIGTADVLNACASYTPSTDGTNLHQDASDGSKRTVNAMTKQPFSTYTPLRNGNRSLEESMSEIQREMDVRKRLFDRWVSEGRMSWTDAHDRLERHLSALKWLIAYDKSLAPALPLHDNPALTDPSSASAEELDDERQPVAA